jgi:signal transduction histidine kinase
MILTSSGANLMMGSFARLMRRTGQRQQENQRLFTDLQAAYRRLKDSAAQAEALAAAEERHRLVRELHDSLTQTLFSMNLTVQAAQLSAQESPDAVDAQLARLQTLSRSAASEVQALTGQVPLRPFAQEGLPAAIQRLIEDRLAQDGLQVTLEVSGQRSFPEAVQATLYRIVQEALNNVTRHAGVCQAVIRLCFDSPHASLEVEDSGCGFDPHSTAQPSGFGLNGMAERAVEIGWTLAVRSAPGRGTCIRVEENAR